MKKKLLYFWLGASILLAIGAIQTIPRLTDLMIRTVYVSSVSELTNTVNRFNTLSPDGEKRTILLAPGTYALATGAYRLHVSNNICIKGAGMNQTTITGHGGQTDNPMVWLFSNCEISDLKLQALNTGANPQLGVAVGADGRISTNVVVSRVWFVGDDDNIALNGESGVWDPALNFNAFEWAFYECLFENKFDSLYISGMDSGPITETENATGRSIARLYSCRLVSQGPGTQAGGNVTNIRMLGRTARVELYGCSLYSAGGTNTTSAAFLGSGPTGADPLDRWPGGLYFNNCRVQIIGTNLVSGGVGACLVQSTNGWAFFNGVTANSNNVVGTGTNFWEPIIAGFYTNSYTGTNVFVQLGMHDSPRQVLVATNSMLLLWTNIMNGKAISLSIYNNTASNINITHRSGLRFMGGASNTVAAGKELAVAVKVVGTNISLSFQPQTN